MVWYFVSGTQEVMISDSLAVSSFSSAESGTTVTLKVRLWSFLCDLLTKKPTSVAQTLMKSWFSFGLQLGSRGWGQFWHWCNVEWGICLQLMEYSYLLDMADECPDPYVKMVYAGMWLLWLCTCNVRRQPLWLFPCLILPSVFRMNRLIFGEDSQETTTRSSTSWGCWIYFWVCFCSCMGSVSVPCISANLEALQPYTWRDLWDGEPQWCHLPCWAGQLQNEAASFNCIGIADNNEKPLTVISGLSDCSVTGQFIIMFSGGFQ